MLAVAILSTGSITASGVADAQTRYLARHKLQMEKSDGGKDDQKDQSQEGLTSTVFIGADINSACIQIAELEVMSEGVNVGSAASGAKASGTAPYESAAGVGRAIDGIKPAGYPNIYHSRCGGGDFLKVDLAKPSRVDNLVVWGRQDGYSSRDVYSYVLLNGMTLVGQGIVNAQSGSGTSTPSPTPKMSPLPPEPEVPKSGADDAQMLQYIAWLGEVWRIRAKDTTPKIALDMIKPKSVAFFMPKLVGVYQEYDDWFSRKGFGNPESYMYFRFTDDVQPHSDFCLAWAKIKPANASNCNNYYFNHITFYPD